MNHLPRRLWNEKYANWGHYSPTPTLQARGNEANQSERPSAAPRGDNLTFAAQPSHLASLHLPWKGSILRRTMTLGEDWVRSFMVHHENGPIIGPCQCQCCFEHLSDHWLWSLSMRSSISLLRAFKCKSQQKITASNSSVDLIGFWIIRDSAVWAAASQSAGNPTFPYTTRPPTQMCKTCMDGSSATRCKTQNIDTWRSLTFMSSVDWKQYYQGCGLAFCLNMYSSPAANFSIEIILVHYVQQATWCCQRNKL